MDSRDVPVPPETRRALDALSLLTGKWQPVVLAVVAHEEGIGFNDLLDAIPNISGKVLSDTLETLRDAGLLERQVVNESPLRVQYELTSAGEEMQIVFDELADWGEAHLEAVAPTVVLVETDRRLTEMYRDWLSDRYAVVRAHNNEELNAALEEHPDVVLFGRQLPGVDAASVPEAVDPECRTILLVDDRPAFDVLDVDCDDVLAKPLVRDRTLASIDEQLSRRGESERERECRALVAKRDAFEAAYSSTTLADQDQYGDVCARIEALDAQRDGE